MKFAFRVTNETSQIAAAAYVHDNNLVSDSERVGKKMNYEVSIFNSMYEAIGECTEEEKSKFFLCNGMLDLVEE